MPYKLHFTCHSKSYVSSSKNYWWRFSDISLWKTGLKCQNQEISLIIFHRLVHKRRWKKDNLVRPSRHLIWQSISIKCIYNSLIAFPSHRHRFKAVFWRHLFVLFMKSIEYQISSYSTFTMISMNIMFSC